MAREVQLNITRPQGKFLAIPQKFRAYVGGFGSGKTYVGCVAQCQHYYEHPKVNQGYFAPTYPQIRDIFYPTIEEVAGAMGLRVVIRTGDKEVHVYSGTRYRGTTLCRSMDRPEQIIGFSIGHALVDELDVLPKEKALLAWRKIIARMRAKGGSNNGVDVTTTPEGFRFVYEQFVKALRDKPDLCNNYGIIQASTYENEINLPPDYIPSLFEAYTAELIQAYLNGQFVNLTSGTIYGMYSRVENRSSHTVQGNESVNIGMDFNVGKMAAVVHVLRNGHPHAVDEFRDGFDTPDMVRKIREKYWKYDGNDFQRTRAIHIYPDASGAQRKSTNATLSDIHLLQQAGFIVHVNNANPPVKDRVNSMNAMFHNAKGQRRYFVNDTTCKRYAECLEQQVWADDGEPDKASGVDHQNDAGGYYIVKEFPIVKRSVVQEAFKV